MNNINMENELKEIKELNLNKKYSEAIKRAQKLIALDPNKAGPYNSIGYAYQEMRKYRKALKAYSTSLSLEPKNHLIMHNVSIVYFYLKDIPNAFVWIDKSLEQVPNDIISCNWKGFLYSHQKNFQKAIEIYNYSLTLDNKQGLIYYQRGMAIREFMQYDKAINDFTKAIELKMPDICSAYYERGITYKFMQNYENARKDFRQATALNKRLCWKAKSEYNKIKNW